VSDNDIPATLIHHSGKSLTEGSPKGHRRVTVVSPIHLKMSYHLSHLGKVFKNAFQVPPKKLGYATPSFKCNTVRSVSGFELYSDITLKHVHYHYHPKKKKKYHSTLTKLGKSLLTPGS
jgi:hypothetical protein